MVGQLPMLESQAKPDATGIILAGGRSRRLGRNKALESIGGQTLFARVAQRIAQLTQEVVVVVADPDQAKHLPLSEHHRMVEDLHPGGGSLGGIFSGLSAASSRWGLVVACDMPFLNLELMRQMLDRRQGFDAVVPVLDGRPEPTHALYSKSCLSHMEALLVAGDLKISLFYDKVKVAYVPEAEIALVDPDYLSFFNVNTAEDLERAKALADQGI